MNTTTFTDKNINDIIDDMNQPKGVTINLTLTSEQFSTLMNRGIESLPNEVLQNVVIEGLRKAINSSNYESLFIKYNHSTYGILEATPSDYLKKLLKEIFDTDETRAKLKQIEDDMIEKLKTDKHRVLRDAITELICGGICRSEAFREAVRDALRR